MHMAVEAVGIKHSGGAAVLLGFLEAASTHEGIARITVFCSPHATRSFDFPPSEKLTAVELTREERSYLHLIRYLESLLPRYCKAIDADLLLCIGGVGTAGPQVPHVTYIQQSLPFSNEATACYGIQTRACVHMVGMMMKRSARSSRAVFVQTPTMRKCVSQVFGLSEERIEVFTPPPKLLPQTQRDGPVAQAMQTAPDHARLLYVGNTSPYKNLRRVMAAMPCIRQACPEARLFMTCQPENSLCQAEGVTGLGYLAPPGLRTAYELATLLVMPSLTETVGLPMLEAMSVDTPVLAADRPYAHDIAEDAAEFFDPLDPADCARKAIALMRDESRRQDLAARGQALIHRRRAENSYQRMVQRILEMVG